MKIVEASNGLRGATLGRLDIDSEILHYAIYSTCLT